MLINVLVIDADGAQQLVQKEVADDYFGTGGSEETGQAESKNEQAQNPESTAE